jgi:hypothetical protein
MAFSKFFFIFMLILTGCTQKAKVQGKVELFSIQQFISNEIDSLSKYNPMIVKNIKLNDKTTTDTILTNEYDRQAWENELTIFSSLDVNKPALVDNYALIDSVAGENSIMIIRALKSGMKTRETLVFTNKQNGHVNKIEIEFLDDNMIYQSAKHLVYYPGKGYAIHTTQDVLMNKPDDISIEAKYVYGRIN